MTEIKSALELALERTQDIKSDKGTLEASEQRNRGRKLASTLLNPDPEGGDPLAEMKKLTGKETQRVKEGIFQTLLANLILPNDDTYGGKMATIEKGFQTVVKDRRQMSYIMQQLKQFFEQYLQSRDQMRENLKQQYEPQLREKERMLAQQMGAKIHLEPESDPDFMSLLAKNLSQLEEQYNQAMQQAKDELSRLFERSR